MKTEGERKDCEAFELELLSLGLNIMSYFTIAKGISSEELKADLNIA